MSDFEDMDKAARKIGKGVKIRGFVEEDFDDGKDSPSLTVEDAFEEFSVDRKSISEMLDEMPSLDSLFTPFDIGDDGRVKVDFSELVAPGEVSKFNFEDIDTRDPDVVRTLAQAEAKLAGAEAQAQAALRGSLAQAETQAAAIVDKSKDDAAEIVREAEEFRRQAQEFRAQAEADREEARLTREEAERIQAEIVEKDKAWEDEKLALLAERESNLVEARQLGHAEGLAAGQAEGRAKGEAEAKAVFQNQVAGLLGSLEKVEHLYEKLWEANGPFMIKLAIEAAEQILNKELRDADDLAARAFSACVEYLSQAHRVRFLARPQDLAQLELARAAERERLGALVKVSFTPDDTLGPGDLIMESDVGRLDATIKNRAEKVLSVLRSAFEDNFASAVKAEPVAVQPAAPEAAPEIEEAPFAEAAPEAASEIEEAPFAEASAEEDAPAEAAPEEKASTESRAGQK